MKLGIIDIKKAYFGTTELTSSNSYLGLVPVIEGSVIPTDALRFVSSGNSSIGLNARSSNQTVLQYSTDYRTWSDMTTGTTVSMSDGDIVYLRGKLTGINSPSDYTQFSMTGNISAKGNINYIWDYEDLNASLKQYCGFKMFFGCVDLYDVSELTLPATDLYNGSYSSSAQNCYNSMFYGCTSLTTAPELPATTLAHCCYEGMFRGCTSLVNAPSVLPATTLTTFCYNSMFYGCTSLTTAPELPATTLNMYSYSAMFYNCTSLNYIKCLATDISALDCTDAWLTGVAPSGTFVKSPAITESSWGHGNSAIPTGWNVESDGVVTITSKSGTTTVGLETLSSKQTLEYSTDGASTWSSLDTGTTVTLAENNEMHIRGTINGTISSDDDTTKFAVTGTAATASGDARRLWNYQNVDSAVTDRCGMNNFRGCSILDCKAIRLPSETTALKCYTNMFRQTATTVMPDLPSTNITSSCYLGMFQGCTSLATVKKLPATNIIYSSVYSNMFAACTSLATVPSDMLPATTIGNSDYKNMFLGCTALTDIPNLPATTLGESCYENMFSGCTSLTGITTSINTTSIPKRACAAMFMDCTGLTSVPSNMLPATTIGIQGYTVMFRNTRISTAPDLPATTLSEESYSGMFRNNPNMSSVKCLATDVSATNVTASWLASVATSGTFTTPASTQWSSGYSGIPTGWTRVDAA